MIRYICEPEKNTECKKTFCQELCKATAFKEYAKRDENGAPIVAKDFEIIPQIKINREVFEKCEEETETITVSKGCLKARKGRFVVYDVEYLKNHIDIEAKLYGRGKEVLAEIKAEIEQKCCITVGSKNEPAITLYDVFQIIDKYKAESEEKE